MGKIFKSKNIKNLTQSAFSRELFSSGTSSGSSSEDSGNVPYLVCLRVLSESIGKMPLELFEHTPKGKRLDTVDPRAFLAIRPNPYASPFEFWSGMEYNRLHYGNAFALISRDYSGAVSLWSLHPEAVEILISEAGIISKPGAIAYRYTSPINGEVSIFPSDDVLHVRFFAPFDSNAVQGVPAREVIADTLQTIQKGNKLVQSTFDNGLHSRNAIFYDGPISVKNAELVQKQLIDTAKGVERAGSTIPLPIGYKLQQVQGGSLVDADFVELSKFTARQISAVLGVPPIYLNDYTDISQGSSEHQQLNFYTNTLQPILTAYEQELNFKLFTKDELGRFSFKFDVNTIMKGDLKSQVEAYKQAINNAILTPNEARKKLDFVEHPDGDILMCNSNYIPLKMVEPRALQQQQNNNQSEETDGDE